MRTPRLAALSISALGLCLVSSAAHATQPLEQFMQRAQLQSFEAREAEASERQSSAEAEAALGPLLPVFSARGIYTRNQSEVVARFPGVPNEIVITPLNQLDAILQLDVPIIDLASYHRYKASQALARSARERRGATGIDIARAVARSYYQFLGASALVASARASVTAAEANLKNVQARRNVGAATDLDLERATANIARTQQDVADAELGMALASRSLETLSGLAPAPASQFPEDNLQPEGALARWLSLAAETPQQRAARELTEATEQSRKAASRALLPTLSGSAQERFTNATGFADRTATYTLQLVLSWRLDYGTYQSARAQAAAVEVQRVRVERTQRASQDAAFEAYQRVQAGIVKSRAARAQARAAARAAELSVERYSAGVATQLDVTQAQRDAYLADASRIQADADLIYARAALRLAAGIPLSDTRAR
jgi:outer membrane protein TolC